jgi:MFS family permease
MKNLRIYFSLVLLNNFWFITSNWLNFWLKYMSLKEVGIIDGIAFLIGIMFEFPSGIISDRWGRKNSLILSQLFQFAGSFIITFASNLYEIGVGFIIFQIGVSMFSGSIESFGYESSRDSGYNYKNTLSISSFFNNFGYLFSLVVGGYLYLNNNNIPNYLFTMNFFLGLLICYFIMEKNSSENSINSHTIEENNIKTDFNSFVWALRKVDIKLILYLTFLSSVVFAFDYGFVKLLLLEAFTDLGSNYLYIFGFTLFSLILSFFLLRIKTSFVVQLRVIFILLALITFFVSKSYEYIWVIFAFLSFITVYISQISLSYFNELVSDDNRAGFLSIFALFYKLPYVFIALILGDMMQKISVNQLFYPSFLGIVFMYLVGKLGYNIAVNKWGRSSVAE